MRPALHSVKTLATSARLRIWAGIVRLTKKAEPRRISDVNRDSGTDSDNRRWLRRLVRPHGHNLKSMSHNIPDRNKNCRNTTKKNTVIKSADPRYALAMAQPPVGSYQYLDNQKNESK